MKLVYIGVIKNVDKNPVELTSVRYLKGYNRFAHGNISEFLLFSAKTIAERTLPGQRQVVLDKGHKIHAYARSEGICGIIITDNDYPSPVVHRLNSQVCDEFLSKYPKSAYISVTGNIQPMSFPELEDYIQKYQDPQQADSIVKIQKELDETKIILHQTIESVLERGEKIDNLVQKSDELSASSKMFYTQAKKQNSCCIVM